MADEKIPLQPQQPTPGGQGGQPGQTGQQGQQGQQQFQIPVDATNRETTYVNFVQAHLNEDEVYMDLGTFSRVTAGQGLEPIVLSHRVIMNFVTAKRLAELLRTAVARHEQMFGVVELDPNRRLRNPQQQQPPRPPTG
jgi:Protein of unknown function (DUF3467)